MTSSTQTHEECGASARLFVANGAGVRVVTDIMSRAGQMLAQRILERPYRKAKKKLMELDGGMLRDISLNRSEITLAVRSSEQERTQR